LEASGQLEKALQGVGCREIAMQIPKRGFAVHGREQIDDRAGDPRGRHSVEQRDPDRPVGAFLERDSGREKRTVLGREGR
jgi:hypothetical protein